MYYVGGCSPDVGPVQAIPTSFFFFLRRVFVLPGAMLRDEDVGNGSGRRSAGQLSWTDSLQNFGNNLLEQKVVKTNEEERSHILWVSSSFLLLLFFRL